MFLTKKRPQKRPARIGLTTEQEEDKQASKPLSQAWITPELIAENQRVWSGAYGRNVSEDEAVEIITNIRRFAETLLRARKERNGES